VNTYDWIIATAHSNINSIIWVINNRIIMYLIKDDPVFPKRVISKWPAIILAVKRIANVPGRIIFLIVSMHTIKAIKSEGVPCGTKWINICWVFLNQPKIIKANHMGKAKERVNTIWLVLVKI